LNVCHENKNFENRNGNFEFEFEVRRWIFSEFLRDIWFELRLRLFS
jgi:hypothetical protein